MQGIIPSITGKIELVYEGEQEGPFQVAYNLMEKAIRTQFAVYFPNPETFKKKRSKDPAAQVENPYRSITKWFDAGNHLDVFFETKDEDKIQLLYTVDGLHAFVKKFYPSANEKENALLMEFVLHGLASHSLISKKVVEGKIEFKDLMGSMLNFGTEPISEEDFENDDFQ